MKSLLERSNLALGVVCLALLLSAPAYAQPSFTKDFLPNPIDAGDTSRLEFTIDNTTEAVDATNLDFTDTLPGGLVVADPSNASETCMGGTLVAMPGSSVITFSGGTVAAFGICTVGVDTTAAAGGSYVNTSGPLTSSAGDSGTAGDQLIVDAPPPGFTKTFLTNPIDPGDTSRLLFTIDNSLGNFVATNLEFTDTLPAGLVVANPSDASDTCAGTLVAVPGSSDISFSGGTVGDFMSCTVGVDTTAAAGGNYVNVSGPLTSSEGDSGTATDTLVVSDAPPPPPPPVPALPLPGLIALVALLGLLGVMFVRRWRAGESGPAS